MLLKSLLHAGVVVGFGAYFLSREKLCPVAQGSNRRKIALSNVYPKNLALLFWCGVREVDFQRDEQVEVLPAPVIPEFARANRRPLPKPDDMLVIAAIG